MEANQTGTAKVISFSLWGGEPKYAIGAERNAELAPAIYPGWRCRFYCAASVPAAILAALAAMPHVELVHMSGPGDWRAMFWRFYPASEPDVRVMISRDTDSRLNLRERAAVEEWLRGDRGFHVMRDHPHHNVPILGGMWGVRAGVLSDMRQLIDSYDQGDFWQVDQDFLAAIIAPRVRGDWLEHDEYFAGRAFPTRRRWREFVGQPFDADERPLARGPTALERRLRGLARTLRDRVSGYAARPRHPE